MWPFSRASAPRTEKREYIGQWPALPLSSLMLSASRSYQEADPVTGENSLQSVAFGSAVDLVASLVSEMRFEVYAGTGPTRKLLPTPGNLLDPAGDGYGIEDWAYMLCQSWFLRGNAYGNVIDVSPQGILRQVDLYHPDRVSVHMEDGRPAWSVNGRKVANDRMFHKRAYPVAGCLLGTSPVAKHADELGLSIAATRFGRSWFQDGGHPGGILSNSEADMSDDNVTRTAKDRFMAALFGTREPLILGRGWKFEQIQIAPEESQFLETRGFTEAQAARIMGAGVAEVLGYDTGGSMTYATTVDRDLSLLKYSADRWFKRVERVYTMFLPEGQFAIIDRESFLDTNVVQKWQVNRTKMETGAYTINEVRAKNNDRPVEWGDQPFALTQAEAAKPEPTEEPPAGPPSGGGAE